MPQSKGSALDDTYESPRREVNYVAELKLWLNNVAELNLNDATMQVKKQVKPDSRALTRPGTNFLKLHPGPVRQPGVPNPWL